MLCNATSVWWVCMLRLEAWSIMLMEEVSKKKAKSSYPHVIVLAAPIQKWHTHADMSSIHIYLHIDGVLCVTAPLFLIMWVTSEMGTVRTWIRKQVHINHHVSNLGGKKLITLYLWLSCIFVVCLPFVCVQEAQIARQRRTVVPSVPQNAEWEARSLFAKEVL